MVLRTRRIVQRRTRIGYRRRTMQRVAVFGNAGGGKSTLASKLAQVTRLPLHPIDRLQWRDGGAAVPHDEYLRVHAELLRRDAWIIDGFGCVPSAWERFAAADTLVYVDLPLALHYLWVTKRLVKGLAVNPEGWPKDSPMWRSTLSSWRVIPLCHRHLTPKYRALVAEAAASKRVHHLRSPRQMRAFLEAVERELSASRR
jgi:adenylate kinase family enzyme